MGQHGDTYVGQRIEARDMDILGHINTRGAYIKLLRYVVLYLLVYFSHFIRKAHTYTLRHEYAYFVPEFP